MAQQFGNLKVKQIENMRPGDKPLNDGGGLSVGINKSGSRWWLFRYTFNGKSKSISCGGDGVTLKQARENRARYAAMLPQRDPQSAGKQEKKVIRVDSPKMTLGDFALMWFKETKRLEFKEGAKNAAETIEEGNWLSPVFRLTGDIWITPLEDITKQFAADNLLQVRGDMPGQYKDCRIRLEQIFAAAQGQGFVDAIQINPFSAASLRPWISAPVRGKDFEKKSYPAVQWEQIPQYYDDLSKLLGPGAESLRVLIMSATRSKACRGAERNEFFESGSNWEWTIPAWRQKTMYNHALEDFTQVMAPLAMDVVHASGEKFQASPYFFTQYGNKPVSEASLRNAVSKVNDFGQYRARDGRKPVTHGMRTAFKSWGLEHGFSDMVTEIALGHVGNDRVARAYTDTNMKGERQRLMDDWSRFVLGYKT